MAVTSGIEHLGVVVVGAGFGGLAAAHALKQRGEDFAVLDANTWWAASGGTTHIRAAPATYRRTCIRCHSRLIRAGPTRFPQSEIRDYLGRVAREDGLLPYIRFGCGLVEAAWDDTTHRWRIETSTGALTADMLIDASGPIAEPSIPHLPGLDRFAGDVFHSARWNHELDLVGRKVVVIGTGASAIQFVPKIQPLVEKLTVVQRSAPWVIPRMDRKTTRFERRLYAMAPWLQHATRLKQYLLRDLGLWRIMVSPRVRRIVTGSRCTICARRWPTRSCVSG